MIMKELSIEEKAKAYDKALKEAVIAHKDEDRHLKATLERIFQELKESKDEKIRKALYNMAKVPRKEIYEAEGITKEQALAWLEKQGEQKPQGKTALEAIKEEKVDNANKVEPQDEFTKFERAVKQVMEEAIECGDTHNLKADAEMLLSLAHNSSWNEEDEAVLDALIRTLEGEEDIYVAPYLAVKCLKSLKDRVQHHNTWKPSDKQINGEYKGK